MAVSAIAGLAAAVGAAGAAGALASFGAFAAFMTSTAALTAFAIGAGLSVISRALMPKPDFGAMMQGVTGTVREPTASRKVIYGKVRVGGAVVFITNSNQNKDLYLIICFACHEIESYEAVYFNDKKVWENGSFLSDWGSYANFAFYDGTQTTADTALSNASLNWGNTHVLRGIAYMRVKLTWDEDRKKFPQGVPNISAVIKGKKLYDPRDGTTSWSQNPALALYDYLTNSYYGLGESASNIDTSTFSAVADLSEEQISLDTGGTHDRYHCDGVLDTANSIKGNIEALTACMGGRIGYVNGKYFVQAAEYQTPIVLIDEEHMVGTMSVQTKQSRRSVFNGVKGVFLSEEENYTLIDYPAKISSTYSAQDGDPIFLDMPLPFVTNHVRAQRLAKIALLKSRQQILVNVPLNLAALQFKSGDFIGISSDRMGWVGKPFEVLGYDLQIGADGAIIVNVQAIETSQDVYDWTTSTDEDPLTDPDDPDANDGTEVGPPTNLSLTETTAFGGDGQLVDAILISWSAPANEGFVEYYELVITEVATGNTVSLITRDTKYLFLPVTKGVNYSVAVTVVNTIGVRSAAITASLTPVGDQTAPSAITDLSASGGYQNIVLSWTNPTAVDLASIDVYRAAESNLTYSRIASITVSTANRDGTNESVTGIYVDQGLAHAEDYFYKLKAIDRSGNASGFSNVASATTDERETTFAPREVHGYVYYTTAQDAQPATPSATSYDFSANAGDNPFTGLTSGWSINPPTPSTNTANTGAPFWASRFHINETTYNNQASPEFSAAFKSAVFDGLVTFKNLNTELSKAGTSLVTQIDGGRIRTGQIDLANQDQMAIMQGKTAAGLTNTGFWLGNDGGTAEFWLGSPTKYMYWDGSNLVSTGLTVQATDGTVLLDASGLRSSEGNNLLYNGSFVYGASGWDTSGTVTFNTTLGRAYTDAGENIASQRLIPVSPNEPLYIYADFYGASGFGQLVFFKSDGSTYTSTTISGSLWSPNAAASQAFRVAKIDYPSYTGNPWVYAIAKFGTVSGGSATTWHQVGVSKAPPVIDPSYASTYIRDLSVDTLQIAGNAVTLADSTSTPSFTGTGSSYTTLTFETGLLPEQSAILWFVNAMVNDANSNPSTYDLVIKIYTRTSSGSYVLHATRVIWLYSYGLDARIIKEDFPPSHVGDGYMKCEVRLQNHNASGTGSLVNSGGIEIAYVGAKK